MIPLNRTSLESIDAKQIVQVAWTTLNLPCLTTVIDLINSASPASLLQRVEQFSVPLLFSA